MNNKEKIELLELEIEARKKIYSDLQEIRIKCIWDIDKMREKLAKIKGTTNE